MRALRQQGLSYNEIRRQVPVSKSSISRWCRGLELSAEQQEALAAKEEQGRKQAIQKAAERRRAQRQKWADEIRQLYWEEGLSVPQIAEKLGMRTQTIYQIMRKEGIPRRSGSEVNYRRKSSTGEPSFRVKQKLTLKEEKLRVAGVMLYWAEGARDGDSVDFTNSDPRMIQLFIEFLRRVCGIAEERLRAKIYCHSWQKVPELEEYWSQLSGIPRVQFTKPYVKESSRQSGKIMPYGVFKIRYSDKRLLEQLRAWRDEIVGNFLVK